MKNLYPLGKRAVRAALFTLLLVTAGVTKVYAQPQGAINGLFTINENGDQVLFSQGNLQYQASTNTWRFAEHQWDYVGEDNANISETYDGWIDLFGWGTSGWNSGANCYQPWSTSIVSDYYLGNSLTGDYANADWGIYNAISNGGNQTGQWRTLTKEEWYYVFYRRSTSSGVLYAKAYANGVPGVILFPDNWSDSYYLPDDANESNSLFNSNTFALDELEQHGAVFLPVAGRRQGTLISDVGYDGYYWSASNFSSHKADAVYFTNSYLSTESFPYHDTGNSVRLVRPAQNGFFGINATPSPSGGGTVDGDGTYQEGTVCTLTATPAAGFIFVNWTENGEVVSTNVQYTFMVSDHRWLLANFSNPSIITFADANVKTLCVANWDSNGDGELSYAEAAAVTNLGEVFKANNNITSFDELQYFTGLMSISSYAFSGCSGLTSITLPKSLKAIGDWAFSGCSGLITVNFTGTITQWCGIQFISGSNPLYYARRFCVNNEVVKDLVVPNGVTSIGDWAFYHYQYLSSVSLPNTLTSIGNYAFSGCSGLTGDLTLPNTLTSIGNNAFSNCSGLTGNLTMSNSVTSIGNYAFYDCSGLTGDLNLPNTLTSIGNYSFYNCSGLTGDLNLPNTLTSIGNYSFYNCSGLIGHLTMSNSVTSIGDYAFYDCSGLIGDLTLPNTLTSIGERAFCDCNDFTSVSIGTNVSQIGVYAFVCTNLEEVYFNATNCIGYNYFTGCYKLHTLTLGEDVLALSDNAFSSCTNLQTIRSLAVVPPIINNNVFPSEITNTVALYVPCESQAAYQADPIWGAFTNYQNKAYELVVEPEDVSQGTTTIKKYGDCDDPLCTVEADPMPHYGFSCWLKNGEVVSTNRVYNFSIEENTTLVARFEPSENIVMHWVPNSELYEDYMMVTGVVNIDGVEQTSTTLELGAFCDDECRGSVIANYCPPLDRYVYQLPVYGNDGDVITFRLFDHNEQQELTMERPEGVLIGDANSYSSTNYFPFYTLYNYSTAEQLYLAEELIEAGMNTLPIASLSFEATNETGKEEKNIRIWMANVSDSELTTTSYITGNMTLVFSGNIAPVVGWNEFVFNENQFVWDGSSNLLVCVERADGGWQSPSLKWKSHNPGFTALAYNYRDNTGYDMTANTYTVYNSSISRVNTLFRSTSLACQTELLWDLNNVIPADDPMVIYFISRIPVITTAFPAEGGEVTGTGEYVPGETATVTAAPYEGYVFTGWMENGMVVSTELEYSFTVEGGRNLIARFERVQTVDLSSGWNWFSTYIQQTDGLAQLENSLGDHGMIIKSFIDGLVQYDNGYWTGDLGTINNEELYMIQTNAPCTVTLQGDKAKATEHPIYIVPGWNWIGYVCDSELSLDEAMSSISPSQNDAVKSRTAYSSYFASCGCWYGNLSTLVPGQGYQYYSQGSNTMSLTYPTPAKGRNIVKEETIPTHFEVKGEAYRDNMNFMAVVTLDGMELKGDRYELAAFVDGVCHGTTKLIYVDPLDRYVAFLTVLGQDGEEVSFRLYDEVTGMIYETGEEVAFQTNKIMGGQQSLYPIHFQSTTSPVNQPALYPNPVNHGESLLIMNASDDMVMEISNVLGVTVKTMRLSGSNAKVNCDLVPGAYTVRLVKDQETLMVEKLIVK